MADQGRSRSQLGVAITPSQQPSLPRLALDDKHTELQAGPLELFVACQPDARGHSEALHHRVVKEISPLEMLLRVAAQLAAASGVIALLVWLTWVMLDVKNMQSGFTLPY